MYTFYYTLKSCSDDESNSSCGSIGGGMIKGGFGSCGVCCSLSHFIWVDTVPFCVSIRKDWGLEGHKSSINEGISFAFSVGVAVSVESGDTLADGVLLSSGVSENFSNSTDPKIDRLANFN